MKTFIMAALLSITFGTTANAQKLKAADVPNAVKNAFTKSYPGKTALWEKEKGQYEASFKQNGTDMSLLYEANGTLLETETAIKISELPAPASAYVKAHYTGKAIKEAAKTVKANGTTTFEAQVNRKDLIFDASGNYLKQTKN